MTSGPHGILERDEEARRLESALTMLARGRGAVLVIEGAAGIGKSTLLRLMRDRAEDFGARVLAARCAESERTLGWGAARQLLDRLPGVPPELDRPEAEAFEAIRRALADAAREQAVVVTVDDVHWSDPESLRLLAYLSRRIDSLAVALVIAVRVGEPSADAPVLQALVGEPQVDVLAPQPISPDGLRRMVAGMLGEESDPEFVAACHRATGGNPFLATELLRALAAESVRPTAAAAEEVTALGTRGVARSVLLQIGRLGQEAVTFARAAAVLGDGCTVGQAARLAELTEAAADAAADALVRAGILLPGHAVRFVHPIVRVAVERDLAPTEAAAAHSTAAEMLAQEGTDPDRVAAHLAETRPRGNPETVAALWSAARSALARGTPDRAARLLERAIAEPPPSDVIVHLLRELGNARQLLGDARARETYHLALEWTSDPLERATIARQIASSLAAHGDARAAIAVLRQAAEAVGERDPPLARCIASELLSAALLEPACLAELRDQLPQPADDVGAEAAERLVLAAGAVHVLFTGEAAARVAELAERALADGRLLEDQPPDGLPFHLCVFALVQADRDDRARELLALALADADRRGSLVGRALVLGGRAGVEHASGQLDRAEADARAALAAGGRAGVWQMLPSMAGILASTLLDRQGGESAWSVLDSWGLTGALSDQVFHCRLLEVRGRVRLAIGQADDALADFEELGARSARLSIGPTRWRAGAALTHSLLGDDRMARSRASAAVEEAHAFGAPRELGVALRALGLVTGGEKGIERLRDAVATLERSHGRLELARALVDLGAALRRGGERAEARTPLRRGQVMARSAGAFMLAARAEQELAATGARGRTDLSAAAGLTVSERRVAELAALGRSNRAIAGELYLSLKTVEVHLTSVYRKLGIRSRQDLAEALDQRQAS